jgi:hypothetical protein
VRAAPRGRRARPEGDPPRTLELAAPGVPQPATHRSDRVDVHDQELFGEARGSCDHFARIVEDDRVAVEDQLVLSAGEVAEREERARVAGPRDEHLLPLLRLSDVVRRRGEIHDELSAREREVGRGRAGLPDVFADRDPDGGLAHSQDHEVAPLSKVAMLVEHAVVGEEVLPVHGADLSAGTDRARVREIAVEPRRADERDDPVRRGRDLLDRRPRGRDEAGPQQEVFGRIARDGQLRKDDEIGAGRTRLVEPVEDSRRLPSRSPDDGIHLRECHSHGFSLTVVNLS